MRRRIFIRGCVRWAVGPSVHNAFSQTTARRLLCRAFGLVSEDAKPRDFNSGGRWVEAGGGREGERKRGWGAEEGWQGGRDAYEVWRVQKENRTLLFTSCAYYRDLPWREEDMSGASHCTKGYLQRSRRPTTCFPIRTKLLALRHFLSRQMSDVLTASRCNQPSMQNRLINNRFPI